MTIATSKLQNITARIPIEDYGWINRYCQKNDVSQSYVVRRAIRMFIVATNNTKKAKEAAENNG